LFTSNESVSCYLKHRDGDVIDEALLPRYVTKSLDKNTTFETIESTKGKRIIPSYVGFIDLKGFSESSRGRKAEEIYDLIKPFLEAIISEATRFDCLIDKTIGDEVMFVVPCPTEGVMIPGIFTIGQFLGGLRILALASENNWNFRIGISVGELIHVKLGNDNYNDLRFARVGVDSENPRWGKWEVGRLAG
jgi:Adenylate and Guanylate cyclase catalytic domain